MKKRISIKALVKWDVFQSETTDRWIAVCDMLNLSVEANTLDDLNDIVGEAMHLLFCDLHEDEELDPYLRMHGWAKEEKGFGEDVDFDIPFELLIQNQNDSQRSLN